MIRYLSFLVHLACLNFVYPAMLCVPEGLSCNQMNNHPSVMDAGVTCLPASDRVECLRRLVEGSVDITVLSNYELYLAHLLYQSSLYVVAETRDLKELTNNHRYEGVAVIRRSEIQSIADLKGAKSCHTGYWRTAGWHIPISILRSKGHMKRRCTDGMSVIEQDFDDISEYFDSACVPGPWAPDSEIDKRLKNKYPKMCELCGSEGEDKCTAKDKYVGYSGALECLLNGGSVAWSKYSEVEKFFQKKTQDELDKYGLLCPDNRVLNIISSHQDVTNCAWAGRPWNAWVVRSQNIGDSNLLNSINTIMEVGTSTSDNQVQPWAKEALGASRPSTIQTLEPTLIRDYLMNANYYVTLSNISCDTKPISMCVESPDALLKCHLLSKAMEASRVRPLLKCKLSGGGDSCLSLVGNTASLITTVDGANVYYGHKTYDTSPIVSEKYGESNVSYYAVAVVKRSSNIETFKQLKGKNSCHTGFGKTAGWKMPIATLLQMDLLTNGQCNYPTQIAKFFSKSCVPGAKDPIYDPKESNPSSLCSLCVGDGSSDQSKCVRNSNERYYSYTGAFRCLVEGGGDVAFIKHTTVPMNTEGNNGASWARDLKESQFRILCPEGGSADVQKYEDCNLERVPAHKVIIGLKSALIIEEAQIMLLRASQSVSRQMFVMFGPFNGTHDLIFKDSATELVSLPSDDIHKALQQSYDMKLEELDNCGPSGRPLSKGAISDVHKGMLVIITALALLIYY